MLYSIRWVFNTVSLTVSPDYSYLNNSHVNEGSTDCLSFLHLLMVILFLTTN